MLWLVLVLCSYFRWRFKNATARYVRYLKKSSQPSGNSPQEPNRSIHFGFVKLLPKTTQDVQETCDFTASLVAADAFRSACAAAATHHHFAPQVFEFGNDQDICWKGRHLDQCYRYSILGDERKRTKRINMDLGRLHLFEARDNRPSLQQLLCPSFWGIQWSQCYNVYRTVRSNRWRSLLEAPPSSATCLLFNSRV